MRGRYKVEQRGRSAFPERELIRYECEQKHQIDTGDDVLKCLQTRIDCWKKQV